jgi:hypothetical protein
MRIQTSELSNTALKWAVAKAEGWTYRSDDKYGPMCFPPKTTNPGEVHWCSPSELKFLDWSECGPIIEREKISLLDQSTQTDWVTPPLIWFAAVGDISDDEVLGYRGPTPLVAAMRCFVASRLGDEVDIPEELL